MESQDSRLETHDSHSLPVDGAEVDENTQNGSVAASDPITLLAEAAEEDVSTDHTDGRTMRRRRNREAVVQSLVDLINEGDLDPTVAKIADRAGVSHRSIFRYFDDLDDLARTAVSAQFRQSWSKGIIPDLGEGSLEHRIEQYVAAQLRTFQFTHQMGRVARSKTLGIPEIERSLADVAEFRLDQARKQFDTELSAMPDDVAASTILAISLIAGFESYDMQRRAHNMSVPEIADVWTLTVRRLLVP